MILISVDTLRADHIGSYGYERETSPRIDALAEHGIRFSHAFSQSSWTLPSHMSILVSQYPHVHGVVADRVKLGPTSTTLAEVLSAEGYETAGIITWIYVSKLFGFDRGFDDYLHLIDQTKLEFASGGGALAARQATDAALQWIEREHAAPFFLFLHYFDPHMDEPGAAVGRIGPRPRADGVRRDGPLQHRHQVATRSALQADPHRGERAQRLRRPDPWGIPAVRPRD